MFLEEFREEWTPQTSRERHLRTSSLKTFENHTTVMKVEDRGNFSKVKYFKFQKRRNIVPNSKKQTNKNTLAKTKLILKSYWCR